MSELPSISPAVRQIVHPLFADIEEPVVDASSHRSLPTSLLTVGTCTGEVAPEEVVEYVAALGKQLAAVLRGAPLDRSTFLKHVLLKLTAAVLPELVLAGLCLGLFLAAVEEPPRFELEACTDVDSSSIVKVWALWRGLAKSEPPLSPLDQRDGQFTWISVTEASYQLERLAAAVTSLRHGYTLLKNRYGGPSKSPMVSGTQLIIEDGDLVDRSTAKCKISIISSEGTRAAQFQVAASLVGKGFKVAAVNAASAYRVAGGFLNGAAHSMEESLCMQSTLFFSLQKAARLAEKRNVTDAAGRTVHIPECGAVVSPSVQIFRQGVDQGYAPSCPSELTAVLSVSMPNRNSSFTDCPIEDRTGDAYEHLLEQKFQAVLWGGVRAGANSFIIPEIGCGVLQNDPAVVGRALARVLPHFEGHVQQVVIMGRPAFFEAVQLEYMGACPPANLTASPEKHGRDGVVASISEPETTAATPMDPDFAEWNCDAAQAAMHAPAMRALQARDSISDFEISEELPCEGVVGEVLHQFQARLQKPGGQARPALRASAAKPAAKEAKPQDKETSERRLLQPSPDVEGEGKPETRLDPATEVQPLTRLDLSTETRPMTNLDLATLPQPGLRDAASDAQMQAARNLTSQGQPLTRLDLASDDQPLTRLDLASQAQPLTRLDLASEAQPLTTLDLASEAQPLTRLDLASEARPLTRLDLASAAQMKVDPASQGQPQVDQNLSEYKAPRTRLELVEDLHEPLRQADPSSGCGEIPGLPEDKQEMAQGDRSWVEQAASAIDKAQSTQISWVIDAVHRATKPGQTASHVPAEASPATAESKRSWAAFTDNPERAECARQLGLELKSKALESRKQDMRYVTMLSKHDPHKTGKFPASKLQQVLSECHSGKRPKAEELQFLTQVSSAELLRMQQQLTQGELCNFMQIWELYQVYREDLDLLFYLYDGEASGMLGPPEVEHVLREISGGALGDKEVDAIMQKADFTPAGAISRMEFAMMVARWQAQSARAAQRETSAPSGKSDEPWNKCTIQ